MRMKTLSLLSILLASTFPAGALAETNESFNTEVFCATKREVSVREFPKLSISAGYSDVDTHVLDKDFRHPKPKIPWSETKVFEDPVVGTYVGVMDRNYIPGASRIHTLWYKDMILAEGIQVFGYSAIRYEFDVMMIPSGDSYLVIRGCDGRFPVNEAVAKALRNQPDSGKSVFIKLFAEGSGVGNLNEIGSGTVKAWKKIYSNWTRPPELNPDQIGY